MRRIALVFFLAAMLSQADLGAASPVSSKTWRLVSELTDAERALFDPRTDTPRDAQLPLLPAEQYPFQPPYTA
jgi:hypothetical protein